MFIALLTAFLHRPCFSQETTALDGLHVIAGFGLNAANYMADSKTSAAGIGLNLRSDVTYFVGDGFGLELSASVMFNNLDRTLLWSTTLAGGVRFKIPDNIIKLNNDLTPYGRLLAGRTSDVAVFDGRPSKQFQDYDDYDANRVQTEGYMFGAGYGVFQQSKSGRIWYAELTLEHHTLEKAEVVEEDGGIQIVVEDRILSKNHTFYALCVTLGFVIF